MPTIAEFNEEMEKQKLVDYKLLLANHIRSELTKETPSHIHVGKELFYWLTESVDDSRGSFTGKIRIYSDSLDKYVDVHLDHQRAGNIDVATSYNSKDEMLSKFKNGHNRFQTVAEFRTALETLLRGGDYYSVLDHVLLNNEELRKQLNQEMLKGHGGLSNNG